jgi:L-ascorbate metabolism protein UlaG (beta-lactamase superfamily)
LVLLIALADAWTALGSAPGGARLTRMQRSPQWVEGAFENPQPLVNDEWGMVTGLFERSDFTFPEPAPETVRGDHAVFSTPPPTGLRVTWLGHSTTLIEIDGRRVLTDPVWGDRASPSSFVGPTRWYEPPIPLAEMPAVDAVIFSHDHYDHLDHATVRAIAEWETTFVAPLGVGAHLAYWGVPEARIVELDWWDRTEVAGLGIVCVPARHASGRMPTDPNSTLWAGYAVIGPQHRAYFSGDTGMFPAMREIGERFGPFDVTLIDSGAYQASWPDWHLGPEQAIEAHQILRGRVMIPIHWGLFDLAYHSWTEPAERVLAAAEAAGQAVIVPRPGESVEPESAPDMERWWPALPWQTAAQAPVISTSRE